MNKKRLYWYGLLIYPIIIYAIYQGRELGKFFLFVSMVVGVAYILVRSRYLYHNIGEVTNGMVVIEDED